MTTKKPEPTPNTFAARRAEREAREAGGEHAESRRQLTLRAGADADNPLFTISHVQA